MQVPTIALGKLQVSRLLLGGNPFAGFSHQSRERDAEMLAWYTDERIVQTLFEAQSLGLSGVVVRGDAHMVRCLHRYWAEGGTMAWVAQTASEIDKVSAGARFCLDQGAAACFVHGGVVDHLIAQQRYAELEAAVETIRAAGVPAGIAGHMPEDFRWAEDHLPVDFYMACYYNPIPRRDSPHHQHGYDEAFPPEHRAERVALIAELRRPAIHYKVLAAGRLPAREGLAFAAAHMRPGDAVCLGVYTADKPGMLREDRDILLEAWGGAPAPP